MASRITDEECSEYIRLSNSGLTTYQIGELFNRHHSTVSKVLRRCGISSGKGSTNSLKEKQCACCGRKFKPARTNQLYCSRRCKERAGGDGSHVERAKKFGVPYDRRVNLPALIKRDGLTCRICGKTCDVNDRRWGEYGPDYPTIDHIMPLSKGGAHVWGNVQVACAECNCVVKKDAAEAWGPPPPRGRPRPPAA